MIKFSAVDNAFGRETLFFLKLSTLVNASSHPFSKTLFSPLSCLQENRSLKHTKPKVFERDPV